MGGMTVRAGIAVALVAAAGMAGAARAQGDPGMDEYVGCMGIAATYQQGALDRLAELTGAPDAASPVWTAEVHMALGVLHATDDAVAERCDPPAALEASHALWMTGAARYDDAAEAFSAGLLTGNVAQLQEATRLMGEGSAFIRQATEALPGAEG